MLNLPNRLFCVNLHNYMGMNLRFIITLLAIMMMTLLVGCNDDDKVVESQRTSIERYLTSSHSPRLIAKEEIENSLEPDPKFYERLSVDLYRYIATYYDEGRDARAEVVSGAEVELVYTAYIFKGSAPKVSMVYATNDADVIAELADLGLNVEYWSEEPLKIKLGSTNIITGLEKSLLGCREGDVVEAYMTQRVAYNDKAMGVVVRDTPVVWYYTINSVVK